MFSRYHSWLKSEERTDMYIEDEDDFDLLGGTPAPTDDVDDEEVEEDTAEEEENLNEEDETVDESKPDEEAETEEKPTQPVKDNRVKALTAERAKRKEAERKLRELEAKLNADQLAKENEDKIAKEKAAYKQKLLEGDLVDEDVADKLLEVLGDDIIKNKIANQTRVEEENFDKQLSELKKDEIFMDADVYKPQIKSLMSKGLSMEEAYFASVGKARFTMMKKDMETEIEQKLLNNANKAANIDIGHAEADKSDIKKGKYTKREQEIARETGLSISEVHKRYMKPGQTYSIEDMENL